MIVYTARLKSDGMMVRLMVADETAFATQEPGEDCVVYIARQAIEDVGRNTTEK